MARGSSGFGGNLLAVYHRVICLSRVCYIRVRQSSQVSKGPTSSATRYFVGYYEVTAAVHGSGFTFADVDTNETLAFGVQFRSAERGVFVRIRSATNGLIENIIRLDVVPP